jgi:predicted transcriptional regulator
MDRVERILALILIQGMKGSTQRQKVAELNLAGFSNVEIADLLDITAAVVSQSLYETKKATSRKATTKKASSTGSKN